MQEHPPTSRGVQTRNGFGAYRFVVGLGNPGRRYRQTRHNVGFMVLKELRKRWEFGRGKRKFHARVWSGSITGRPAMLAAPQTYMNNSGRAVAELMAFYKADASAVLVVLDDLALPVGRLRARDRGSAGGHKGLADILRAVGTEEMPRLRVGIGAPPETIDAVEYVLTEFADHEKPVMSDAIARAADAVEDWAAKGITHVMDHYNRDATNVPNR